MGNISEFLFNSSVRKSPWTDSYKKFYMQKRHSNRKRYDNCKQLGTFPYSYGHFLTTVLPSTKPCFYTGYSLPFSPTWHKTTSVKLSICLSLCLYLRALGWVHESLFIQRDKMSSAGIFKQSMGARNRVGIGLSYRPTRLHSLAELVSWNRFLASLKV